MLEGQARHRGGMRGFIALGATSRLLLPVERICHLLYGEGRCVRRMSFEIFSAVLRPGYFRPVPGAPGAPVRAAFTAGRAGTGGGSGAGTGGTEIAVDRVRAGTRGTEDAAGTVGRASEGSAGTDTWATGSCGAAVRPLGRPPTAPGPGPLAGVAASAAEAR